MEHFDTEFRTLKYVIDNASRFLLFAHNRPDPDTVGANLALREYLVSCGKQVDIACFDPFPENLRSLSDFSFLHPDSIDFNKYEVIIASDSVDRGFHVVAPSIPESIVTVLIDHHPNISVSGDVRIIDAEYSSSSELVYLFLSSIGAPISKPIATFLLLGLMFDTGAFQHSCVTPQVMHIAAELIRLGAPATKISHILFDKKNISALKLWGRALEKAKLNPETGMLATVVTEHDIIDCEASAEDIYQVASLLSAVPDAKFSLVLSEREEGVVRGSLRSTDTSGIDVSAIAKQFGGGGHKLASGFEVPGKILETEAGWQIV